MQPFAFRTGIAANAAAPATVIAPRRKNLRREMATEPEFSKEVIEPRKRVVSILSTYAYAQLFLRQ
jgi:hypothetical protein